jgi:hypothetical protein
MYGQIYIDSYLCILAYIWLTSKPAFFLFNYSCELDWHEYNDVLLGIISQIYKVQFSFPFAWEIWDLVVKPKIICVIFVLFLSDFFSLQRKRKNVHLLPKNNFPSM